MSTYDPTPYITGEFYTNTTHTPHYTYLPSPFLPNPLFPTPMQIAISSSAPASVTVRGPGRSGISLLEHLLFYLTAMSKAEPLISLLLFLRLEPLHIDTTLVDASNAIFQIDCEMEEFQTQFINLDLPYMFVLSAS